MRDPFRNYDAWLEAPFQRMIAEGEAEMSAWDEFCDSDYGIHAVDSACIDVDHPDHAVYVAWVQLMIAIQAAENRREEEALEERFGPEPDEDIMRGDR